MINIFETTSFMQSKLMLDEAIQELVGNRIFQLKTPDVISGDYILLCREQCVLEYNKMGISTIRETNCVQAHSENYTSLISLSQAICNVLCDMKTEDGRNARLVCIKEKYENGRFIATLSFEIV